MKDMAMPLGQTSYGDLKHAINATQILIHKLEKHAGAVQITGNFRYMPSQGTTEIRLLSVGRRLKDLTNKFISGPRQHKLDSFLRHKKTKGIEYNGSRLLNGRYIYALSYMGYEYTIYNLKSTTQMAIAQLINTGPEAFTLWLTSKSVNPHALPWLWTISQRHLIIYNDLKPVTNIKTENDVFKALGYKFIGLEERRTGTPDFWASFKI